MTSRNRTSLVLPIIAGVMLVVVFITTSSSVSGIIADFVDDYPAFNGTGPAYDGTETPTTGWDYMWNPLGVLADSANYQSLVPNTVGTDPQFGAPQWTNVGNVAFNDTGQGNFRYGRVSTGTVHPGVVSSDYRSIMAYTIQPGEEGNISISGSSLRKYNTSGNGVDLDIYVNDTLIGPLSINGYNSTTATNFDGSLGSLSVGDTVYVTLGHNSNPGSDASIIDFSLFSGATPGPSVFLTYNSDADADNLLDPTVNDATHVTNATEMALGAGGTLAGGATNAVGINGDASVIYIPGSDGTLQTLAEAVAADQHFDISFDVQGLTLGESLSLTEVTFKTRPNTNNSSNPARYGPMTYQWQASINGGSFSDVGAGINWDATGGDDDGRLDPGEFGNAKSFSFDFSGVSGLTNGDNVTLRTVFRNGDNTGGGSDFNGSTRYGEIIISGEVVQGQIIPEPSAFLIWSLGLLGLAWYARRRRTQ